MGTINLRNSLFGYNKDDVFNYIKALNDKADKTKSELNEKISSLEGNISGLKNEISSLEDSKASLLEEKDKILSELEEYKSREAAITELSESIGRLYIVAQANAKIIANSAKDNADIVNAQAKSHLAAVDSANHELSTIKSEIAEMTRRFTEEIERISVELTVAKTKLEANSELIEEADANNKVLVSAIDE